MKKTILVVLRSFVLAGVLLPAVLGFLAPSLASAATFTNQICQPAANGTGSITQCVNNIYIVAVATAGFGGVILFTAAGYMYMIGTSEMVGKAKKIMTSVILGMLILFGTYAILNTINPNLTNLSVSVPTIVCNSTTCPAGSPSASSGGPGGTGGPTTTARGSVCTPIPNSANPASAQSLQSSCFGPANATRASSIANGESGGSATIASGTDKCDSGLGDGKKVSVSYGLFQINISANKVGSLNCPSAFTAPLTAAVLRGTASCAVKSDPASQALYQQCVAAITQAQTNITQACSISNNGTNWAAWGYQCTPASGS